MGNQSEKDMKKPWDLSSPPTDFEKEAKEGWRKIGEDQWGSIENKLSQKINQAVQDDGFEHLAPKKNSRGRLWSYGIAASIVIIIGIGLFSKTLFNSDSKNHILLFNQYYQTLESPEDNFRSDVEENSVASLEHNASDAFDELDYKRSIAFYSELLKESPRNPKYTLFLGLSYINDGKFDEAILLFNNHSLSNEKYDDDIQWYLALAHLRKGEIQTSKLLLRSIANDQKNYYSPVASELVNKMKRLK